MAENSASAQNDNPPLRSPHLRHLAISERDATTKTPFQIKRNSLFFRVYNQNIPQMCFFSVAAFYRAFLDTFSCFERRKINVLELVVAWP